MVLESVELVFGALALAELASVELAWRALAQWELAWDVPLSVPA